MTISLSCYVRDAAFDYVVAMRAALTRAPCLRRSVHPHTPYTRLYNSCTAPANSSTTPQRWATPMMLPMRSKPALSVAEGGRTLKTLVVSSGAIGRLSANELLGD